MTARDVLTPAWQGGRTAMATLTIIPVGIARWDPGTMRWAMTLAPAAGVVLACCGATVLWLGMVAGASAPVATVAAVGVLALLTRGLHLDGLADLADGLGSARPASGALEVMRRSDIGPFGVLTLLIVVGLQVACLVQLSAVDPLVGVAALFGSVLSGRLAITWACRTGIPAARPGGLGAMVASAVSPVGVAGASAGVLLVVWAVGLMGGSWLGFWAPIAVVVGLGAAEALRWHATRRLGGITGDVLGALSETATTAALLTAVLLVG